MLVIEGEELATVRDALDQRRRASGVGTVEHARCLQLLRKLGVCCSACGRPLPRVDRGRMCSGCKRADAAHAAGGQ